MWVNFSPIQLHTISRANQTREIEKNEKERWQEED